LGAFQIDAGGKFFDSEVGILNMLFQNLFQLLFETLIFGGQRWLFCLWG